MLENLNIDTAKRPVRCQTLPVQALIHLSLETYVCDLSISDTVGTSLWENPCQNFLHSLLSVGMTVMRFGRNDSEDIQANPVPVKIGIAIFTRALHSGLFLVFFACSSEFSMCKVHWNTTRRCKIPVYNSTDLRPAKPSLAL